MPFEFNDKIKSTLIIYAIIIAIILIQKPRVFFNSRMELKILVINKENNYSIPLLYVFIIASAIVAYFLPRL
jgi:hypothetical protein